MLIRTSLLLLMAPFGLAGAQVSPHPQTVVFVCEHGTVKSVVAMAWFNKLARERGLTLRAISRGTAPDPTVPMLVRRGLEGDSLTLGDFTPLLFTSSDVGGAVAVISFDQPGVATIVAGRVPASAWDSMPAVSDDYAKASAAIRRRVTRIVDSLAAVRKPRSWPPPG